MSRNSSKKKKSTSKYRRFKISPLIPVLALIEVIVLVAISTYAWFAVSQEKTANTGLITVDADSGLDIEFKNANYDDSINLWDYIPDDFEFSPVSSLDGRNVFVPTSGTFGGDTTNNIKFREGTVNDINTKYVNVDFMLTNQTANDVNVYLNDNSHFKVYSGGTQQNNSRALRLAFYTNDGIHGNVSSSILSNTNQENAAIDKMEKTVTVYFSVPEKNSTTHERRDKWKNSDPYAYVWKRVGSTNYEIVSWPGSKMTHVAGNVYSYTFSNKEGYTNIIFDNGNKDDHTKYSQDSTNYTQTNDLSLGYNSSTGVTGSNGKIYYGTAEADNTGATYNTKTVYFRKPTDWAGVRAHAFYQTGDTRSFTAWPGDVCKDCGADVYSYTFPTKYDSLDMNKIVFNNTANENNKTADLDAVNGRIYYFNNNGNGACSSETYSERKIYFYNSIPNGGSWVKPYVKATTSTGHVSRIPMTKLSATTDPNGVFYATIPSIYTTIAFEDRNGYNDTTTNVSTTYKFTQGAAVTAGNIYRPVTWNSSGYTLSYYSYTGYVGEEGENTYAVISPGVSAGFQRSYTPVVGVAAETGVASQVVPAFACSIDNYFKGSENPIFTIPQGGMLDLSMIIWLEGTDEDCTEENYASVAATLKDIDLKLEFSTNIAGQEREIDNVTNYTFRFYDKTREVWTSDRLTNSAGVSVAPVMQLYDNTEHRGYLMHAASTTYINGKRKVDLWECSANSNLYTAGHDLYFRRVDPYNEDEVWNYWHPVNPNQCNNKAREIVGTGDSAVTYINFTAFSDGAPASAAEGGIAGNTSALAAATNASTPSRSCGGLWGKYTTQLLTVIDGSDGHWLMNDQGALCIKYTYSYGSSKSQTIEYKASGPILAGQVYYFVVPTDIVNSSSYKSFTFHRFWGFDNAYAMNIKNRNANMNFDTGGSGTFTVSTQMYGPYAYIAPYLSTKMWFGTAINYINISYTNSGNNKDMFAGGNYICAFHTSTAADVKLYTVAGEVSLEGFNGYLTVAPYGASKYQLRHTSANYDTIYDYGDDIDVTNRNAIIYYWAGGAHNVGGAYNNNQGTYGWPQIPSVE